MFNYFQNYQNNYTNKKLAFDAISKVIDQGTNLLSPNLTNEMFDVWFKYSKEILEMVAKDNPAIMVNYLNLSISLLQGNMQPYEKLNQCIRYLIDTLKANI